MKINISKKQYNTLIMMSQLSGWVLGILGDSLPDEQIDYKKLSNEQNDLEKYILSFAKEFNQENRLESYEDELFLKEEEAEKYHEIIFDYEEYVFWSELENRLAKRDFYRTITKEEKKELEKNFWLPKRFFEIEQEYRDEFEENDIERLEIKEV
ncbi:MAG: hypothetical protein K9M44_02420 [Candidatus Pacebacteria bacterium]|nr:hypothetical protein [Candidatus Paceibacterota bacterium]